MKKFNKKQMEELDKHFRIYDNDSEIELESWTDGGVDMIFCIYKDENIDYLEQFKNYIDDFDIDEQIDLYRQDEQYRKEFSISKSLKDFEGYLKKLRKIYKALKELDNERV